MVLPLLLILLWPYQLFINKISNFCFHQNIGFIQFEILIYNGTFIYCIIAPLNLPWRINYLFEINQVKDKTHCFIVCPTGHALHGELLPLLF